MTRFRLAFWTMTDSSNMFVLWLTRCGDAMGGGLGFYGNLISLILLYSPLSQKKSRSFFFSLQKILEKVAEYIVNVYSNPCPCEEPSKIQLEVRKALQENPTWTILVLVTKKQFRNNICVLHYLPKVSLCSAQHSSLGCAFLSLK